jgi:hypothetical protein
MPTTIGFEVSKVLGRRCQGSSDLRRRRFETLDVEDSTVCGIRAFSRAREADGFRLKCLRSRGLEVPRVFGSAASKVCGVDDAEGWSWKLRELQMPGLEGWTCREFWPERLRALGLEASTITRYRRSSDWKYRGSERPTIRSLMRRRSRLEVPKVFEAFSVEGSWSDVPTVFGPEVSKPGVGDVDSLRGFGVDDFGWKR